MCLQKFREQRKKLASRVDSIGKWRGGNFDRFGQSPGRVRSRLFAGKPSQFQRFVTRSRNLVEKLAQPDECGAHSICKRALQTFAERIPIRLTLQHKVVHPAVAALEHFDQQFFHLLPAVVAPQQQLFDGRAERRADLVDFPEGFASGAAIEFVRLLGDLQASAEAGEQRLLQGQVAAK